MKKIIYIIFAGLAGFLCVSCGAEVSHEEIRELPRFSADYYQQALKSVNERIENYPQNADAYFKKGTVLEKLDNPENAIINYKKAIKLDSLNASYHKSLASLFFKEDKLRRAEENASRAERLGDHTADLQLLLAEINIRKEAYNVALNHLNRAIDTAPGSSVYIIRKGNVYMYMQDTARARDFFLRNMHRIKPDVNLYESLADIYSAGRNYQEALVYLDSSLMLAQGINERIITKKSEVLQRSGDVPAAKKLLNHYLQQDSTNFALSYKLAELHYSTYVHDSALYYLNNAILIDSHSKEAFLLLGRVYDRKRMYYTARDQFSNALLIDTSYQQAKLAMRELDRKIAYINRAKKAEEVRRSLPQLESIKPKN